MSKTPAPKLNNDPALAMCVIWHADCDLLEEAARFASMHERTMFDATDDAERDEAEQAFNAAAKARDRRADKLEILTRAIFKTKAQTLEGAAAKLRVAVRDGAPSPDDVSAPWSHLRSIQRDLDRLVEELQAKTTNDNASN